MSFEHVVLNNLVLNVEIAFVFSAFIREHGCGVCFVPIFV